LALQLQREAVLGARELLVGGHQVSQLAVDPG
jgi:hypothetical protein